MTSLCVIGHISKDKIRIGSNSARDLAGGVAIYGALAARRLGARVTVLTKLARDDAPNLTRPLTQAGIDVIVLDSPHTTSFQLTYDETDLGKRILRAGALAAPFTAGDLDILEARGGPTPDCLYLGPLTDADMPLDVLQAASARGRVALDVQGCVRSFHGGSLTLTDWPDKAAALPLVHTLKADAREAEILTGEPAPERAAEALAALGADEIVLTFADLGSMILAGGHSHPVPAWPPRRQVDATGCGDTYFAAYLVKRLEGERHAEAGRFAAAAATLKLEGGGPLAVDRRAVEAFMSRQAGAR